MMKQDRINIGIVRTLVMVLMMTLTLALVAAFHLSAFTAFLIGAVLGIFSQLFITQRP